jgi:hypothetical protein
MASGSKGLFGVNVRNINILCFCDNNMCCILVY